MSMFDRPFTIVTVAAEASSESDECQQAVVASIRNRVRAGRWQKTMAGCCVQRYQYSEWLPDAGDNADLERVLSLPENDPQIIAAAAAYDAVMADETHDPSHGATHFFSDDIPAPDWAKPPARRVAKYGRLSFYADVP